MYRGGHGFESRRSPDFFQAGKFTAMITLHFHLLPQYKYELFHIYFTKWTLLEFRTQPTFLEILISKSDFGPVKLPGLSRNGPQALKFMPYRKPAFTLDGARGLLARQRQGTSE